jgi:hypothetical protein
VMVGFIIGGNIGYAIWLLLKKMVISRFNHSHKTPKHI